MITLSELEPDKRIVRLDAEYSTRNLPLVLMTSKDILLDDKEPEFAKNRLPIMKEPKRKRK